MNSTHKVILTALLLKQSGHTHGQVRRLVYASIWAHFVQMVPSAVNSSQYKIGANLAMISVGHGEKQAK